VDQLGGLLHAISPHYRVLETAGSGEPGMKRFISTLTDELYLQHHRGQFSRYKVRYRKYLIPTHASEVKAKNNKGRTRKQRIPCDRISGVIEGRSEELPERKRPSPPVICSHDFG
jgi:hypothetical protein